MKSKATSIILRYGTLLSVLLIATEAAKRSYISNTTDLDFYIAAIALLFLALGALIALKLRKEPVDPSGINQKSPSIVGSDRFSKREAEALLFLCLGYTNTEIAKQLGITENTVKTHLKNIYSKLGVTNRTQAAAEVKMLNIVE